MSVIGPLVVILSLAVAGAACGGEAGPADPKAPKTAAARARAEANPGDSPPPRAGKRWGGWRYRGAREECFFVVGRACFPDLARACAAAACKPDQRCNSDGAGPATVRCE